MFSLESDEMTALWPNDSLTFTFHETFSNSIPKWTAFVKEVFDLMISIESDKITALWPNDFLTLTFYGTSSNHITNWKKFCKRSFLIQWIV